MTHVDVVVTDWSGGQQRLAGRVISIGHAGIKFDAREVFVERMLPPVIYDPVEHREVKQDDGDEYIVALHHKYETGSYVHVSDVHDDGACTFGDLAETIPAGAIRS